MQLQLPSKKKCNELGLKLVMYSSGAEGIECSLSYHLNISQHLPGLDGQHGGTRHPSSSVCRYADVMVGEGKICNVIACRYMIYHLEAHQRNHEVATSNKSSLTFSYPGYPSTQHSRIPTSKRYKCEVCLKITFSFLQDLLPLP